MKLVSLIAVLMLFVGVTQAQEKVKLVGGADLVSAYVSRGNYDSGASIQPSLAASLGGFTLSTWGSADIGGAGRKEVNLMLHYSIKGFTLGITDFWWEGERVFDYFHYAKGETAHRWEANLSYQLPFKKFPLLIMWNTMFAGNDYNAAGKRSYSTYIELRYPFAVGKMDMTLFLGGVPWHSPSVLTGKNNGVSVCNIGVTAQRTIKCTDNFSIPVFTRLIFNPAKEDIHLVFGVSFMFDN